MRVPIAEHTDKDVVPARRTFRREHRAVFGRERKMLRGRNDVAETFFKHALFITLKREAVAVVPLDEIRNGFAFPRQSRGAHRIDGAAKAAVYRSDLYLR